MTQDDLRTFHRRWFHPSNFVVAASGDFDREVMREKLESVFADWPFAGDEPPAIPTNAVFASPGAYLVNKDVNQGRVSIMLPGVMRTDPDYFSIVLMNRILGGGGFTSRIVNRVRSDEGLAYAASSSFPGGVYFPEPFVAAFQTKSRTVAYATSIVLEEMKRMASEPVPDAELETAQRSMIETFPRAFASKTAVVRRFADDEFTGRFQQQPDYYKDYRDRVAAVTVADVQRVAKEHLESRAPTILVVGDKLEILKGTPEHPEQLQDLADGPIVDLPLRDPLTMRPLPQ
jgi:zinc protease